MKFAPVALATILALFCPAIHAGQIILKNGDRLTGSVVKSDGKTLTIKTQLAGTVTVPWDAVERLTSDEALVVTVGEGKKVLGSVSAAPDKVEVKTPEGGSALIDRSTVTALRSRAEQAAHEAQVERMRDPSIIDLWGGTVDFGMSLARGNADTFTFSLGLNAVRTTPRDKITLYGTTLRAMNSTTGESVTTASSIRGGGRYDLNLTKQLFTFGNVDFDHDPFQRLDLRLVVGGGLGIHAIKKERTTLDLFGGATSNQEYFNEGADRTSAEALLSQELTHKLSSRVLVKQRLAVYPNLTDRGEYRMTLDASAVTNVTKWIGVQMTVSNRFLSNPVVQAKRNDVLVTTGLRFTFAR